MLGSPVAEERERRWRSERGGVKEERQDVSFCWDGERGHRSRRDGRTGR